MDYLDNIVKLIDFETSIKNLGEQDLKKFINENIPNDIAKVRTEFNLKILDTLLITSEIRNIYENTITEEAYDNIFSDKTVDYVLNNLYPSLENFLESNELYIQRKYLFKDLDGNVQFSSTNLVKKSFTGMAWGEISDVFDRTSYIYNKLGASGVFGIDISHHNGIIKWENVYNDEIPERLRFVIVKATDVGSQSKKPFLSSEFKRNWKWLMENKKFLFGAYHFYQPVLSSPEAQAESYISHVKLEKGNIKPVVDVENYPECDCPESKDNFVKNLEIFLNMIELHYKTSVIIYTGDNFFKNYLLGKLDLSNRALWIARYNSKGPFHDSGSVIKMSALKKMIGWQYSETGQVNGIPSNQVDLNFVFDNKLDDWIIK